MGSALAIKKKQIERLFLLELVSEYSNILISSHVVVIC